MDTSELVQCLQLNDQRDIERKVGSRPHVFRWFLRDQDRRGMAARLKHDHSLHRQWSAGLETNRLPGHLTVPVVLSTHHEWPMAAPAFLLPLCWKSGPHSPMTPLRLRKLADQVLLETFKSRSLHEHFPTASSDWGLHWCEPGWEQVDLADLDVSPESAYAPLAIGLASAVQELPLATELLATGYRNPDSGKWEVGAETLKQKLIAGIEAGKKKFAVPGGEVRDVEGYCRLHEVHGQVVGLEDEPTDLYRAVQPAVLLAGMEPTPQAPRADRITWYLTRPTNPDAAKYYQRAIMNDVISDMRNELESKGLEQWRPEHLVSIVSAADELVILALQLFSPKYCHLIYTRDNQDMKIRFEKLETWVNNRNEASGESKIVLRPVPIEDSHRCLETLVAVVANLEQSGNKGSVLVDSTPGKRAMSMTALQGTKQGDRVLCWWHDTHPGTKRAVPFSVEMLLWEIGSDRVLIPLVAPSTGSKRAPLGGPEPIEEVRK